MNTLGKTKVVMSQPWGLFSRCGHRVLCADGKIRACELASTPDTFFSIPARIKYKGKTISGYITTQEMRRAPFQRVHAFRAHTKHVESGAFPFTWPDWIENEQQYNALIASAY